MTISVRKKNAGTLVKTTKNPDVATIAAVGPTKNNIAGAVTTLVSKNETSGPILTYSKNVTS